MRRIAIVATHPVQYQVPWFRRLSAQPGIDLTVFFAQLPTATEQGVGFGVPFQWDVPLDTGYRWEVLDCKSGPHALDRFFGTRARNVRARLAQGNFDAVILTGWNSFVLVQVLWACERLSIPRIVRGESNAMRPRPRWVRWIHRRLLRRYDYLLAIGQSNREFYLNGGVGAERIFSCPYFIDNKRFVKQATALSGEREHIRREWGVPAGDVCLVYAGKLIEKKRIFDLLQALDVALRTTRRLHLLVVGSGELLDRARGFAEERALPVTFAGFLNQSEIARAYVAGDCLVLPSDYGETWGLVVNEAMACGRPALVSDRVGCGPDLIQEGVTGWTFPFGDVPALAQRLVQISEGAAELRGMGERARKRVLTYYSVENAVAGTLATVEAAVRCHH